MDDIVLPVVPEIEPLSVADEALPVVVVVVPAADVAFWAPIVALPVSPVLVPEVLPPAEVVVVIPPVLVVDVVESETCGPPLVGAAHAQKLPNAAHAAKTRPRAAESWRRSINA